MFKLLRTNGLCSNGNPTKARLLPSFAPSPCREMSFLIPRNRHLLRTLPRHLRITTTTPSIRHQSSAIPEPAPPAQSPPPTSQPLSFPCLDTLDIRTANLRKNPPPKQIDPANPLGLHSGHETFYYPYEFVMDHGGVLPEVYIAYETWGTLNAEKSNAILLHTGLSASSHAKSHAKNRKDGWWEHVIGPGKPLDTNKYYIICTNPIGGCFGSSGPSSIHPTTGKPYATTFPIITIFDMVRAQFKLLDFLGIDKLFASVGNSMGGMQSLAAGVLRGGSRVERIVTVSAAARSFPSSIAMRFVQRQVLMADPHWKRGEYYDSVPPHAGMKLAREIATITYRSGPEWDARFARTRLSPHSPPAFCADYQIERYLDYSGEKWWRGYDANSMLYISKAMDLFDMSASARARPAEREGGGTCLPATPYELGPQPGEPVPSVEEQERDLVEGFGPLRETRTLVVGAVSDILFPARQQREIVECLRGAGNERVEYVELSEEESLFGHDSFLKIGRVGEEVGKFLDKTT